MIPCPYYPSSSPPPPITLPPSSYPYPDSSPSRPTRRPAPTPSAPVSPSRYSTHHGHDNPTRPDSHAPMQSLIERFRASYITGRPGRTRGYDYDPYDHTASNRRHDANTTTWRGLQSDECPFESGVSAPWVPRLLDPTSSAIDTDGMPPSRGRPWRRHRHWQRELEDLEYEQYHHQQQHEQQQQQHRGYDDFRDARETQHVQEHIFNPGYTTHIGSSPIDNRLELVAGTGAMVRRGYDMLSSGEIARPVCETLDEPFRCIGKGRFGIVYAVPRDAIYLPRAAVSSIQKRFDDDSSTYRYAGNRRTSGWADEDQGWDFVSEEKLRGVKVCVKRTVVQRRDERWWLENDAMWQRRVWMTFLKMQEGMGMGKGMGMSMAMPRVPELYAYLMTEKELEARDRTPQTENVSGRTQLNGALDVSEISCPLKWTLPAELWFERATSTLPWRDEATYVNQLRHEEGLPSKKWLTQLGAETPGAQEADQIILMERIPPMPLRAREKLIDHLHPLTEGMSAVDQAHVEHARFRAKAHAGNADALLKVCLGRGKKLGEQALKGKVKTTQVNLRDYDLDLPTLLELMGGEQVDRLIKIIARSLAIMHWKVGCDARDVDFVLGGLPPAVKGPGQEENVFDLLGEKVCLWLLDFNQVQAADTKIQDCMTATEQIEKAFTHHIARCTKAYFDNEPHYPTPSKNKCITADHLSDPHSLDTGVNKKKGSWSIFKKEYLIAGIDCRQGFEWHTWNLNKKQEQKLRHNVVANIETEECRRQVKKWEREYEAEEWVEVKKPSKEKTGEWWNLDEQCKKMAPL